jgi:hypothetical protein
MHQGLAFRLSICDVVADAIWQAITSSSHRNKDELQNSIHYLLPQREKDKFKVSGVTKPIMDMVHHQYVTVELSTHLLAAQREIESLRTQLWNSDATI